MKLWKPMTEEQLIEVTKLALEILKETGEVTYGYIKQRLKQHYINEGKKFPGIKGVQKKMLEIPNVSKGHKAGKLTWMNIK